jgi:1,2-diacylglycerol 3-alpha-glucosyltransferase
MKIVWLIQNLVPYHHARFEAFAQLTDINAYLIQVTNKDRFSVLEFKPKETSYKLLTLFPGIERVSIEKRKLQNVLSKTLLKINPDCICVSGWGMDIGQLMHSWALDNDVPIVIFSESTAYDEPRVPWKEWVESQLVTSASSALVGGKPHKEYINQLGIPEKSIFLGHNVVDSVHFSTPSLQQPANFPDNLHPSPFFLACTRFGKKKNLPRLVRAYAAYCKMCSKQEKGVEKYPALAKIETS